MADCGKQFFLEAKIESDHAEQVEVENHGTASRISSRVNRTLAGEQPRLGQVVVEAPDSDWLNKVRRQSDQDAR